MYFATPVDVLFLLLPLLERAGTMYCELEHILVSGDCPAAVQLAPLVHTQLQHLCDVKTSGEQSYYKLNETKVSVLSSTASP
jgi:hypothetical protein